MLTFVQYINESMNKTLPFVGKRKSGGELQYEYKTNNGRQLLIRYYPMRDSGHDGYSIQFEVDKVVSMTHHGDPLPIFATVVKNITEVFRTENPSFLIFGLEKKRKSIYTKLFKRFGKGKNISVYVSEMADMYAMVVINNSSIPDNNINTFVSHRGSENVTQIL